MNYSIEQLEKKRKRIDYAKRRWAIEHPYLVFPCGIVDRFYKNDKNCLTVRDATPQIDWYTSFRLLARIWDAEKASQWLAEAFQSAFPEFGNFIPESLWRAYDAYKTHELELWQISDDRFFSDPTISET